MVSVLQEHMAPMERQWWCKVGSATVKSVTYRERPRPAVFCAEGCTYVDSAVLLRAQSISVSRVKAGSLGSEIRTKAQVCQ